MNIEIEQALDGLGNQVALVLKERQTALQVPEIIAASNHPVASYLASLAPGSRPTMRQSLQTIAELASNGQADARTFEWHRLRFQHTNAIRSMLAERYAPSTANKMLSALKMVLKHAWRLGLIGSDDYNRAVDLAPVKGKREPAGRNISPSEIKAIFQVCAADENRKAGIRDAALLVLMRMGLRRHEVVQLQLSGYRREEQRIVVKGKGNKERSVPLGPDAILVLEKWLEIRGSHPGALLLAVNKGGRILKKGITGHAVYKTLQKRAEQAGVKNIKPHDWRRTFAGDMLDAGIDIVTVQKLMGHANPATTAAYDRRPEETKRKAVAALDVLCLGT